MEKNKIPPIHERYKQILQNKASNIKKMEVMFTYENAIKNPENANPAFKPNLLQSQEKVKKNYEGGFMEFLREMNVWKDKKERKI